MGNFGMKKFLLSSVGVLSLASIVPASAADLAARPYTKAPPMMVAAYDWSGFYVGINGGGGSSHKCWDLVSSPGTVVVGLPPEGCHDATGGTVGGQVGYRWQSQAWVFGVEAQGNWANFKGSNNNVFFPATYDQSKIDAFGLFTGRVGYAWNNVLVYVKGGAAVTSDKYESHFIANGLQIDSANETRWGGVVGVGVDYGFTPNWTLALEYDHMFMGTHDVTAYNTGLQVGFPAGTVSAVDRIRQDVDLVTVRLNYKFAGPVVAKY
jgi:outer membrane immunogenic protein